MNMTMDQSLQRLRIGYVAPWLRRLDAFWSWWIGELILLLPPKLQSMCAERDQCDFIEMHDDALVIRRGTLNEKRELARIPLPVGESNKVELAGGAKETVLLLDADKVLVKSMTLPVEAEENLREVLSFEMDRRTPFSADHVYYDFTVTSRDSDRKTLTLDLVVAPRKIVDGLLDDLVDSGLHVDTLTTWNSGGTGTLPVNLLPRLRRSNRNKVVHYLNAALAGVAVLLLVTAISLPLLQKRQLLRELEPQLVEAVAQAKSANELRMQVERLAAGSGYLVRKKQNESLILETINEVTRALPDHTWINRLDIDNSEVQMQGQSSSAAMLISLLEGSEMLRDVQFRSPVIRVPSTGEERFHLSAQFEREDSQ